MERCSVGNKLCKFAHDYPCGLSCVYQAVLKGKGWLIKDMRECPHKEKK